jgi:phosphatidylinositol kinase/protein kinase (PI-3  family)
MTGGEDGEEGGGEGEEFDEEELNEEANKTLRRINQKLNGMDFNNDDPLAVEMQVDRLIKQAVNPANLCVLFVGWCAFW